MMLRVSVEMQGEGADLTPIVSTAAADESRIPQAAELIAFAEAVVQRDDANLERLREQLIDAVGPEAFVDAATVVGNFERMVRIADATGIALDAPLMAMTADIRNDLGINEFGAAENTPEPSALASRLGSVASALVPSIARVIGRFGGRS